VVLLPILAVKGDLRQWRRAKPVTFLLLFVAVAFLCGNYILYVLGLDNLRPETTQIVIQLAPMFLLVGSILVFKEKFLKAQWAGFALFTLGFFLFFHERLPELLFSLTDYKIGVLLVVLAAATWAVYALAQKQLLETLPSGVIMLAVYVAGGLVFLPFARPAPIAELDPVRLAALAFCALNTLVAYGTFSEALNHWDATRVSATLTVVPVITLGSAFLGALCLPAYIQREPLDVLSLLGASLVVAGSMLASLWQTRTKPEEPGKSEEPDRN
jgi:drug/metabolite transporter (DMT)-like permease